MKELLRKFCAVLSALLILGSTTSWTVDKHYCMGHLVDIAWFDDASDCGMAMANSGFENDDSADEMSCCDDELISLDGQDELKLSFSNFDLVDHQHYVTTGYIWEDYFIAYPVRSPLQTIYPPPKLVVDIQLLDEVFLI
ncbi:MAG: HYC_CC_PP family protein [Flavobacteriaceae bacterium]